MTTTIRLQIRNTPKTRQAELQRKSDGTPLARAMGLPQTELLIDRATQNRNKHIAVEAADPLKVHAAIEALEVAS